MNLNTMHLLAVAVVTATLFLTGTTLWAAEGDDRIEPAFRQTYVYRMYLKDDAIQVGVKGGVVTLTGVVLDEIHKALARSAVAKLPGVVRVENQLTVETEVVASTDAALVRKVVLAIQFHRDVMPNGTIVEVKDGYVTLKGKAHDPAQKKLTTEYATAVRGVKGVQNEMTVATTLEPSSITSGLPPLDDDTITSQIETILLVDPAIRPVDVRVLTKNGEVTLTGQTQNAAQYELIVKIVSSVRGVTSIKNQMTIEGVPRNN